MDSNKRWLVLGASGMLGQDMVAVLTERGEVVRAASRTDVDVTDAAAVAGAVNEADVVVNCAAYSAVDAAETDEDAALTLNAHAAGTIAAACRAAGARLVQVSTDYVFDGNSPVPYAEDTPTDPASAYGRTKAEGERLIMSSGADALIVRTAWLYGARGGCFPKTIVRVAAEKGAISVVDDQHGQPTWTRDLAAFIVSLVDAHAPAGVYHGTSSGECSWFEFAQEAVASAAVNADVTPTTTEAFPRPAPRPARSVLGHSASTAIGVAPIGDWRERWRAAASEVLAG